MARWPQAPGTGAPPGAPTATALDAAQEYERRGWSVVPIPYRAKAPVLPAWQNLRLGADDLARHFPPGDSGTGPGIGVLLGAPSAGLLDVDLDWRVAALLGAHLLPATPALFGRVGKPRSHYLYVVQAADIPLAEPQQYRAPRTATSAAHEDKDMVCELRASGQQTVFPPSIHESGEPIYWHGNPDAEPALVESRVLRRATELVAAAALLVPHWRQGQRNALQMALAGGLLRAGWTAEQVARFIDAIAAAGGDADTPTREKTGLVIRVTHKKLAAGEEVSGWPTVAELVDDEQTMRRLGAWMRLSTSSGNGNGATVRLAPLTDAGGEEQPAGAGVRKNGNGHGSGAEAADVVAQRGVWVRLSTVTAEQVEWVWAGRIPKGKLTLIGGDPGVGKSFLLLALLAHVTRGWAWPDGQSCPGPADCILLCGEDGLADTVRPRVDALGGDPARVWPFKGMTMDDGSVRGPSLASALDVAEIERKIEETGAQMVLVDPINTYLDPKMDTFKGPPVRAITTPLAGLAERTGVAVVLVCHLTKATLQQALYRMPGSVDFVAAARSVLAVGYDPQSEDGRRLLLPVKNNLSAHAPGLGFNIVDGALHWDNEEVSANAAAMLSAAGANGHGDQAPNNGQAHAGPGRPAKVSGTGELIRLILRQGPRRAMEVFTALEKAGISESTVKRAKKDMGMEVESFQLGSGAERVWYWRLQEVPSVSNPERSGLKDSPPFRGSNSDTLSFDPLEVCADGSKISSRDTETAAQDGQSGLSFQGFDEESSGGQNTGCHNGVCSDDDDVPF